MAYGKGLSAGICHEVYCILKSRCLYHIAPVDAGEHSQGSNYNDALGKQTTLKEL